MGFVVEYCLTGRIASSCTASSGNYHVFRRLASSTSVCRLADLLARRHSLLSSQRSWRAVQGSGCQFPGEVCATPVQLTLFASLEMSHQWALTDMFSGSMKRCRVRAAAARSTNWTQSSTVDTKTKTVRVKQLQAVGSLLTQDADTMSAMRWIYCSDSEPVRC